jgi:hypothetical protein
MEVAMNSRIQEAPRGRFDAETVVPHAPDAVGSRREFLQVARASRHRVEEHEELAAEREVPIGL